MASSVDTPNMFGIVLEDSVIFCLDMSGSMHNVLPVVKLHLQETLRKMAAQGKLFNIIEFNSKVTAWADILICSTRENAALAMEWVGQLSAQTDTNTLGALQAAFSSPQVDAVYLVTDSLPEQHRNDILDEVVSLSNSRPVHCICITDSAPETALTDFLGDLSVETFGSLHIVLVSTRGYVERVTPVYAADHGQGKMLLTLSGCRYTSQKSCSLTSTLQVDPEYWKGHPYLGPPYFNAPCHNYPMWPNYPCFLPVYYPYGPNVWSQFYPAKSWLKDKQNEIEAGLTPGAGAILIGKKVLARRHEDGLFYLGTVQSQIPLNQCLVAFGPCKHGDFLDTKYQETDVFDIIDYNKAARHSILMGDYVLAPWELEGEKFRPGKVIHGQETRHSDPRGSEDSKLTVSLDNGIVAKINPDIVVWIPKEFHVRVQPQLQMPQSARQDVQSQDGYPRVTKPGYPSSGPRPKPEDYACINQKVNSQITEHKKSMDALEKRRALRAKGKTRTERQKNVHWSYDRDRNTKESKAKGDDEKPETNTKREEVSDSDDSDLGFYDDFGLEDPSPSTSTGDIGINTESLNTRPKTVLQMPQELRDKPQYPKPAGAEQDGAIFTGRRALAIGKIVVFLCLWKTCTYFGIGDRASIDGMERFWKVYCLFYSEVVGDTNDNNNNNKKNKKNKK